MSIRPALAVALACALAGCTDGDRAARRAAAGPHPQFEDWMRVADPDAGRRLFARCAACHANRPGAADRNGPNLAGIVGRSPGQGSRSFAYSYALRNAGGIWTRARLDAWLADPQRTVPGTTMPPPGLTDPLDRADLIAYLAATGAGTVPPALPR